MQDAEDKLRTTTCTAISHGGAQAFRLHRDRFERLARRYPELRVMATIGGGGHQGPHQRSWPSSMVSANERTADSKISVSRQDSMVV